MTACTSYLQAPASGHAGNQKRDRSCLYLHSWKDFTGTPSSTVIILRWEQCHQGALCLLLKLNEPQVGCKTQTWTISLSLGEQNLRT
jgi:hypothetical protein